MLSLVISFITGILLSLAFPRADMHWLAWFVLAPLLYSIYHLSWKQALTCGLAFGIGFFASLLYWIALFGKSPWIALSVFEALHIVAFVAVAKLIGSRLGLWGRLLLLPALWVTFEWIRSLGMLGLTWGDLGYSQYKVLPVVQIASITGVWGISFLIMLSNSALANLAAAHSDLRSLRGARTQVLFVGLIISITASYGLTSMYGKVIHTGSKVRAAVVQGNISQDTDENIEFIDKTWRTYRAMTKDAAKGGTDLIVWPETVVPGYAGRNSYIQSTLADLAANVKSYLLVGGWDNKRGKLYNSAFLIGPNVGILGRYAKVHLVPFGEFIPVRKYMPFLRYYRVRPSDSSPGADYNIISGGSYKIGTAICFESTFPYISRRLTASGAELLCIITNDEWFGWTSAAEQHMAKSVFRAVENRRYLLRGAATGISCIIDPYGRILARSELFRPGVLRSDVWTQSEKTFYTRHGDWLVYICLILVSLFAISGVRRNRGMQ